MKSDHSPLLFNLIRHNDSVRQKRKNFIFEVAWQLRDECFQIIQDACSHNSDSISNKLVNCKTTLVGWRSRINRKERATHQSLFESIRRIHEVNEGD